MWSDAVRDEWLVNTLALWLDRRVPAATQGRRNFRLVCADGRLAIALQEKLEARGRTDVRWFVRPSSADDAVRLRHGRPEGVAPEVCVAFVLLWSEGSAAADRNAQSLVDLPSFDVQDILNSPSEFELPEEASLRARFASAADAWEATARPRVRDHLLAAWEALRSALRLAPRGGDHPLRPVSTLEAYGRFLHAATIPDSLWSSWPQERRADLCARHVGQALAELRLFCFPAWASDLGLVVNPNMRPESVRRTGEDRWDRVVEQALLENLHWASDHGALADALAGKRTVHDQLRDLTGAAGVDLGQADAPQALEQFCHDGDEEAFAKVQWLFYRDPNNRRGPSMGLHGLLIARGRRQPRVDPIERLAEETANKLGAGLPPEERSQFRGLLETYRRSAPGRAAIAALCNELAGGERHQTSELRAITDLIAGKGSPSPSDALALADKWRQLDGGASTPDVEVADTLLLGVARLLSRTVRPASATDADQLVLALLDTERADGCTAAFAVGPELPFALSEWMRSRVRDALPPPEESDEEDEGDDESLSFRVSRRSGRTDKVLGTVKLGWRARDRMWRTRLLALTPSHRAATWDSSARVPAGAALLNFLHANGQPGNAGIDDLRTAWNNFVREVGVDTDGRKRSATEILDLVAPVGRAGRAWVDAWAVQVGRAAAGGAADARNAEIAALEAERDRAIAAEEYGLIKPLMERLKTLRSTPQPEAMQIDHVRQLLRVETLYLERSGEPLRLALTAHHPLVMRHRILSDTVLAQVIEALWRGAWPEAAAEDLEHSLNEWALPEPQHVYGIGPKPLVFDGWSEGFAVYGTLDGGRDTDAEALGVRALRDVVGRYAGLFPAAADRLRIRVAGDDAGQWAWSIIGRGPTKRADIDLVTRAPRRELTAFESEALSSGDEVSRFEPGPDGASPSLRLRRLEDRQGPYHLSLLHAERLGPFQADWGDDAAPEDELDPWDPRLHAHEPRPAATDYRVQVPEAPDRLSAAVARAVARVCNRTAPYSECYTFDPAKCGPILRAEQQGTDWLVLASRQPAYRAVQACQDVSTLLDFSSTNEGGRPVHVCVSLGSARGDECTRALGEACRALLGAPVDAGAILDRARRLAPGLALRALAAPAAHLEGLLGLLLTEAAMARPTRLILSLDQHHGLLSGSRGVVADLVALEDVDGTIALTVGEAKFTLNVADFESDPVIKGQRQVQATIGRLARFGVAHPLAARTRAALVRAAVQQVHLLDRSRSPADLARLAALVDELANPATPIRIEPFERAEVHAWSWHPATSEASTGVVRVHSRATTEAALGGAVE